MQCPNCSSDTWDNTEKVKGGWRGPLRKCKDQACGWVLWPPKEKGAKSTGAPAKAYTPKWTWAGLQDTYRNALRISASLVPTLVKNATSTDVVSGAATIFIAASRDGVLPAEPLDKKPAAIEAAEKEQDDVPW